MRTMIMLAAASGAALTTWGGGVSHAEDYEYGYGGGETTRLTCGSPNYTYQRCEAPAGRIVESAELARRTSGRPCTDGRGWGWDSRGVWVDEGCRGEFVLYTAPERYGAAPGGAAETRTLTCFANSYARRVCEADVPVRSARLVLQRTTAECVYGDSWGVTERGVWVEAGCGGDFELNGDGELYGGEVPRDPYGGPLGPAGPGSNGSDGAPGDYGYGGAGYGAASPYMVSSELWTERGFTRPEAAVAACARRVMQAAWDDADYSAQFAREPDVTPLSGYGGSFNPNPGGYGRDYRVSGPILVHNREGFERWNVECRIEDGELTDFNATPSY